MDYANQLRHPLWQKKRLEILSRDNFTCQTCFNTEMNLQIHHLSYCDVAWETPNDELITLCESCHKKAELIKLVPNPVEITKSISELKSKLLDNNYSKYAKNVFGQGISLLESELIKSKKLYNVA